MQYRNDGISTVLYEAIKHDSYSGDRNKRDFSATELLWTPKQFWLMQRHYDEIVVDASTQIYALLGTALHSYISTINISNSLQEERIRIDIDGNIISGAVDCYREVSDPVREKILYVHDFKVTSVWSYVYQDQYKDWEKQLNTYAYLLFRKGFNTDEASIIPIYRDWRPSELEKYDKYPPQNTDEIPFRVWDIGEAEAYLRERIAVMREFEHTIDDDIPVCSIKDRWQKPDKWAIYKGKRRNRASRVCDSEKQAIQWIKQHPQPANKAQYEIIKRESTPLKCLNYCKVKDFCNFYKWYQTQNIGRK